MCAIYVWEWPRLIFIVQYNNNNKNEEEEKIKKASKQYVWVSECMHVYADTMFGANDVGNCVG